MSADDAQLDPPVAPPPTPVPPQGEAGLKFADDGASPADPGGPTRPVHGAASTATTPILERVDEESASARPGADSVWLYQLMATDGAPIELLDLAALRERLYVGALDGNESVRPAATHGAAPAAWGPLRDLAQVADLVAMLELPPAAGGQRRIAGWQRAAAPPTPVTVDDDGGDPDPAPPDPTPLGAPRVAAGPAVRPDLSVLAAEERRGAPEWLVPALLGLGALAVAAALIGFLLWRA